MPLQKIVFKPGVNRENTRYTTEGGWYECDKIRFRQGNPEKIGGWTQFSPAKFLGLCRSLWAWITLAGKQLVGVGTNTKFYISQGGSYYDQTPIRLTSTLTNPFTATAGSSTITVYAPAHGCDTGAYVTYSGNIVGLGGNITAAVLTGQFIVTVVDANTYRFTVNAVANATDAAGSPGGGTVTAQYQVNPGPETQQPLSGWGAGTYGTAGWGMSSGNLPGLAQLRLWNQYNYGEDLIYGPRGGGMYYWDATVGVAPVSATITIASPGVVTLDAGYSLQDGTPLRFVTTGTLPTGLSVGTTYFVVNGTSGGNSFQLAATAGGTPIVTSGSQSGSHSVDCRGIPMTTIGDASTPVVQNGITISDTSRFVLVFGTNELGSTTLDPMLVRWSDQEDPFTWTPSATNQAGGIRLSHGSQIVTNVQARQEIVAFTDQALYSLQYIGPPYVWSSQLLGDNISIAGPNATALASGVIYWMGRDKFYAYGGTVQTLNCDLRRYVFNDINLLQNEQIFCGTNEGFNEVWWFYCSKNSTVVDRYVVYNYVENAWYYGTMSRTAWLDSGLLPYPVAADYNNRLLNHEVGVDDVATGTPQPIEAYISSSEFDINDGHNLGFVWRVLPDLTFDGSTDGTTPEVDLTLYPMVNSGSGVGYPGVDNVRKKATYNVTEEFSGQVYTRVRGRQLIFKISSNKLGTTWQLGAPRIDIKPDGRK